MAAQLWLLLNYRRQAAASRWSEHNVETWTWLLLVARCDSVQIHVEHARIRSNTQRTLPFPADRCPSIDKPKSSAHRGQVYPRATA